MTSRILVILAIAGVISVPGAFAQSSAPSSPASPPAPAVTPPPAAAPSGASALPDDYVIGAEDVLGIVFWRNQDLTVDVTVRPDGRISLPLLNDIQAAGLTPEQLRLKLVEASARYLEDPTATVVVKQINSRRVYITGQVARPGPYPLMTPTTVLQLLAIAGGLSEYADSKHIVVMRTEDGKQLSFPFDYKAIIKRKNLQQNIVLKPGDTVVVP